MKVVVVTVIISELCRLQKFRGIIHHQNSEVKMKKISDWISNNVAYIVIMKAGSHHCIVNSSLVQKDDEWMEGNAGVQKTICLYDAADSDQNLTLIIGDQNSVLELIKTRPCHMIKQCLVIGPEMIVRTGEISIIEKSVIPILGSNCFDDQGAIKESVVVWNLPELQNFWSAENGFSKSNKATV